MDLALLTEADRHMYIHTHTHTHTYMQSGGGKFFGENKMMEEEGMKDTDSKFTYMYIQCQMVVSSLRKMKQEGRRGCWEVFYMDGGQIWLH